MNNIPIAFRDDDIDGAWEAPRIDNPACKDAPGCGPWAAPMISNPAYKGAWRAPLVDNPNYRVSQSDVFIGFGKRFHLYCLG